MSEIKGQLLGIILVLGLFVTISAVATAVVSGLSNKVVDNAEDAGVEVTLSNSNSSVLLHY